MFDPPNRDRSDYPAKPLSVELRRAALLAERSRVIAAEGDVHDVGYGWHFTRAYLPRYTLHPDSRMVVPPAAWHLDFDREVFGTLRTGARRVFLAPRGYAKSTKVSLVAPLICLARQLKQYVLLVSNTHTQAKLAMSQIIHELDHNEELLADFPHLRRAYVNGRPVADRDDDIAFASGARLQALGAGGSLRGRRNREQRPDLVLCDDLEDDEGVLTKARRDKLDTWLSAALMGALGPRADVYVVGTLLHHDAVLGRLMKRDGWQAHRYEAVTDADDLSTSTWPEWWSCTRLEQARREMGAAVFNREMLHRPIDPETAAFRRADFRYRAQRQRLLEAAHGEIPSVKLRIAIDPAVSEKTSADYSAIAVVAQVGASPELDVLDVWRGRLSAKRLAERVQAEVKRWSRYSPIVVSESVAAQAWLAQALRELGLAVREVKPQRDKVTRAAPLGVRYENAQVYHDESLRDSEFENELVQFPAGEYDDQVDAVVYAASDLSNRPTPRIRRL